MTWDPPKFEVGDIIVLKRVNNEPDNDKYDIFYCDEDLNYSWESMNAEEKRHFYIPNEYPNEDMALEDIGTKFLVLEAELKDISFRLGYYRLLSLSSNQKYTEDYFKVDFLAERFSLT